MTYETFLARIAHADAFERLDALDALAMEADAHTVARAAARLLADEDPGVREEAARLLENRATEEAAALIVPYIASDDITVRNLAGEVLVKIGAAAVGPVASGLDDDHHDVRKFVIDVLAQLPAHHLADRIAACLEDDDDNVVLAAVDALGDLGAVAHHKALRALYDREPLARPGIVTAIGAFGSEADLSFLEQALADEDPVVQYTAAEALARQHDPEVLDLLLRKIDGVGPMARPIVLSSIIKFNEMRPERAEMPASIKGYLVEMLDDFDIAYRCAAVQGLQCFLDGEMVDAMMAHAGQDDTLDVEIFKTLAAYPDVFRCIVANVEAGRVTAQDATGFVLGLLAQQRIPDEDLDAVSNFLTSYFGRLDAETKVAAIGLSQNLQHPVLHAVVLAGLSDPDTEVNSFAADAAYTLGLDPSQAA